jgi:hypothetical protein
MMTKEDMIRSLQLKDLKIVSKLCKINLKGAKTKKDICEILINKKNIIPMNIFQRGGTANEDGLAAITACTKDPKLLRALYETSKNIKLYMDATFNRIDSIELRFKELHNIFETMKDQQDVVEYMYMVSDTDNFLDQDFWDMDDAIVASDIDEQNNYIEANKDKVETWTQAWVLCEMHAIITYIKKGKHTSNYIGKIFDKALRIAKSDGREDDLKNLENLIDNSSLVILKPALNVQRKYMEIDDNTNIFNVCKLYFNLLVKIPLQDKINIGI